MSNLQLLSVVATAIFGLAVVATAQTLRKPSLSFAKDKPFTVVQFTDTQDDENIDPRTVAAMNNILDREKPDLVVITGDVVSTGECDNLSQLRSAIEHVAKPMEDRRIPWAVTLGNHDLDGIAKIGITPQQMMNLYRAYPHNINPEDPKRVYGAGNGLLEVKGANGKAAFGIWLIDSNAYAPDEVASQKLGGYDWIRSSQVAWYVQKSTQIEQALGKKLPSLMFFHICLPEYGQLAATAKFEGERNEPECPASINSGMFAAILDRGDVHGVYVGHDHVNTYEGTWYGVRLGYSGSVGYGTYGLKGDETERNRLRGARVFTVRESDPKAYLSKYVLASSR